MRVVLFFTAAVVFPACQPAFERPADLACAEGICEGFLTPSELSVDARDIRTTARGRGDHWFCRPESSQGDLLVHLVGTGSDPADDHVFPRHACELGFLAIAPMYDNVAASRQTCDADDDECFTDFHASKLFGPDGIEERALDLLRALDDDDPDGAWPTTLADVSLSGHSQGNGHALFWARRIAASRVVLLSGVADRLRSGEPNSEAVSWIASFAEEAQTPPERVRSYLHIDEDGLTPVADSRANLDAIGVPGAVCAPGSLDDNCARVEFPASGCGAINAHISVVIESFGERCQVRGDENENAPVYEHLLRSSD